MASHVHPSNTNFRPNDCILPRAFLVQETCLDVLFQCLVCTKCQCSPQNFAKCIEGDCLFVTVLCPSGHLMLRWSSRYVEKIERQDGVLGCKQPSDHTGEMRSKYPALNVYTLFPINVMEGDNNSKWWSTCTVCTVELTTLLGGLGLNWINAFNSHAYHALTGGHSASMAIMLLQTVMVPPWLSCPRLQVDMVPPWLSCPYRWPWCLYDYYALTGCHGAAIALMPLQVDMVPPWLSCPYRWPWCLCGYQAHTGGHGASQ